MKFLVILSFFTIVQTFAAGGLFNFQTGQYLKRSDLKPEMFQEDMRKSSKSSFLTPSLEKDAPMMSEIQSTFDYGYNVTGAYSNYISTPCHYTQLQKLMVEKTAYTSDLAIRLQKWVQMCQPELSRFQTNSLVSLLNYAQVRYPLEQNSKLHNVIFNYDQNLRVRGIMAIKDRKKRPLVVFRNGVYGDASESTVSKNFIMQVFDESPFHMLFLGNLTGEQFMRDNGILAMGGFDEGRQYHEIIKQLVADGSPYKDLIEDVHIMGVSLGGNGALFSALYNSYLPETPAKVKSVMALCPVVNLENSLNNVFSNSPVGKIYSFITYHLLKNVFKFVPVLATYLNAEESWSQEELTTAVKKGAIQYYIDRTRDTPWDYAPFVGRTIQSERDFWAVNDFTAYADQVTTPTLVIHAQDDFIVPSEKNSDVLYQKMQNQKSEVGIVKLENGSHCAYSIANGWPTLSTLMREFILKHSSYQEEAPLLQNKLQYVKTPQESSMLVFARYNWVIEKNKDKAQLKVTYLDKRARDARGEQTCRQQDYRFANSTFCYRGRDLEVKLSSFAGLNLRVPASDFEANLMSRWLNTHVTPLTTEGQVPLGSTKYPTQFTASGIFEQ